MSNRTARQAPIVRLPPKSSVELLLVRGTQVSIIFVGAVALVFALSAAEFVFAPASLGIVVGLMFGPVATAIEEKGLAPALSALLVLLGFIVLVCLFVLALATPLSFWLSRLPRLWAHLQRQLSEFREPLEAISTMREQLRELAGDEGVPVSVDDGMNVESMATLAPAVAAQMLIFLACLYFFIATRHRTRTALLKICLNRRLRWRMAHIFRDVERTVSRYLIAITVINIAEGCAVAIGLALLGIQSAALWGGLAVMTNFVVFIGPIVMVAILFMVGLAEFDTLWGSLLPVAVYLGINMVESQFVTPAVIGHTMTLNPFVVLLSVVFWIWLWGAPGGFIAIPTVLIAYAVARNLVPGVGWGAADDLRYG